MVALIVIAERSWILKVETHHLTFMPTVTLVFRTWAIWRGSRRILLGLLALLLGLGGVTAVLLTRAQGGMDGNTFSTRSCDPLTITSSSCSA